LEKAQQDLKIKEEAEKAYKEKAIKLEIDNARLVQEKQ